MQLFRNRQEAGRVLAGALVRRHPQLSNAIVLALPRGGVPVGAEVAGAIGAPLDVFVVRKLGTPGQEELAMGAIASGDIRVLNEDVIASLGIDEETINEVTRQQMAELRRREEAYRGGRAVPELAGRTVILVDDGLATGSTMRAAARAVRLRSPAQVIIAVPVAAPQVCQEMRGEADEVICPLMPEHFYAVGAWYQDFTQTTDQEVRDLLQAGGRPIPPSSLPEVSS